MSLDQICTNFRAEYDETNQGDVVCCWLYQYLIMKIGNFKLRYAMYPTSPLGDKRFRSNHKYITPLPTPSPSLRSGGFEFKSLREPRHARKRYLIARAHSAGRKTKIWCRNSSSWLLSSHSVRKFVQIWLNDISFGPKYIKPVTFTSLTGL